MRLRFWPFVRLDIGRRSRPTRDASRVGRSL